MREGESERLLFQPAPPSFTGSPCHPTPGPEGARRRLGSAPPAPALPSPVGRRGGQLLQQGLGEQLSFLRGEEGSYRGGGTGREGRGPRPYRTFCSANSSCRRRRFSLSSSRCLREGGKRRQGTGEGAQGKAVAAAGIGVPVPADRLPHELPFGLGRLLRHAEGHLLRGLVLRGGRAEEGGGRTALTPARRLLPPPPRHRHRLPHAVPRPPRKPLPDFREHWVGPPPPPRPLTDEAGERRPELRGGAPAARLLPWGAGERGTGTARRDPPPPLGRPPGARCSGDDLGLVAGQRRRQGGPAGAREVEPGRKKRVKGRARTRSAVLPLREGAGGLLRPGDGRQLRAWRKHLWLRPELRPPGKNDPLFLLIRRKQCFLSTAEKTRSGSFKSFLGVLAVQCKRKMEGTRGRWFTTERLYLNLFVAGVASMLNSATGTPLADT